MEKLVYVLWKRDSDQPNGFRDRVLGEVATRLQSLRARKLEVNLGDRDTAYAEAVRRTKLDPPPVGILSFWLDSADDRGPLEDVLAESTGSFHGYLVVESVPIRNTTQSVPLGQRTPGVNMIALLERPDWIEWEAWIAHWHGHHRKVALETQCTFYYTRNVVVRALTADAPPWQGIVEEGFPAEAVTDSMLWYCAQGNPETMQKNLKRMVESCQAFLDLDRVESHPTSQYRISE